MKTARSYLVWPALVALSIATATLPLGPSTPAHADPTSPADNVVYLPTHGHSFADANSFHGSYGHDLGPSSDAHTTTTIKSTTTTTIKSTTTTTPRSTTTTSTPATTTTVKSTTTTQAVSNGINYHGGPVMNTPTNVYEIWYGNWTTQSTPARQSLISTFLTGIGGTPYFNINTSYTNAAGQAVSNSLKVAGSVSVSSGYSTSLSDASVAGIVANEVSTGALPNDPNGIYLVLTSKDVAETSGFLTKYCGWHSATTVGANNLKLAFIGDPSANLAACAAQSVSPNGDAAGDAMVSVIAHELSETVTDPLLNAWYNTSNGEENGDLCAWNFGATSTLPSGAAYNVTWTVNGTNYNYLIQQIWANAAGGYCALKY